MKNKILICLLSLITAICCVFSISGCVYNGTDGKDGKDGINGINGKDGKDGLDGKNGTNGIDGQDGKDGEDGKDGKDGKDGIDGKDGTNGADGKDGEDGVGIASVELNDAGELVITYTDKTTQNIGKINNCTHEQYSYRTVEPDCTSRGFTVRVCNKCGYTDFSVEEACGHKFETEYTVCEATCTKDGLKFNICSVCQTAKAEILEGGHNYVDNVCTKCGDKLPTQGLKYEEIKNADGEVISYAVAGLGTATDAHIVIPSEFNGKPVTEIKELAFVHPYPFTRFSPESVTIGDSIVKVGDRAFSDCHNLKSVTIGKNVKYVGDAAFYDCPLLETVYWNATACEYAGSIDSYLFLATEGVKSIIFGEDVTSIPNFAFNGNVRVAELTIPVSMKNIGDCAFSNFLSLKNIYYQGTISQWNAIVKAARWDLYHKNYTIHCADGDIVSQ